MEWVTTLVADVASYFEPYAHPNQDTAAAAQLVLICVGGIAILILWMRWQQWHNVPLWVPTIGSLVWVGIFLGTIQLQSSFYGEADTRCHEYQNGTLAFELIQPPLIVTPSANNPTDETLLLLVVRASERWADKFHICAIPAHLPMTQKLLEAFGQREGGGDGSSFGTLSFTFGNGFEAPNVTWHEFAPPPEKGPPDDPGGNI